MSEYSELVERIKKISNINHAQGVLRWDQEVMMPEEGTPARAEQLSALSSIQHELLVKDKTKELFISAEEEAEKPEKTAVIREIKRKYRRADRVPNDLVQEISKKQSNAHPVWKKAKENQDYDKFKSVLKELLELKKEYAEHIEPDRDPYEVLFEDFEPYLGIDKADQVLTELGDKIVPLLENIKQSSVDTPDIIDSPIKIDKQRELTREVLDSLGYDWSRGRLDEAPHPFSSGNQFDARITTRYDEEKPLDALTSTIHEFGHASYTHGLPKEHYGTPLGDSRDLVIHESQSRFWENNISRSREFIDFIQPKITDILDLDVEVDELYRYLNQVHEENKIRVEADELTYHLHIILRFEIEKQLIGGEMTVDEVPVEWNNRMEEYLGIRPDNDAEGCLQDIHWSHGSFGYFPTYTLGSVLARQLYVAAEDEIGNIEDRILNGDFDEIMNWLREEIHSKGQRYRTDDLIENATGKALDSGYFIDYVSSKFGDIYGV